jgi:pimeloyl-ACP methyl ester carboxylesterase
VTEVVLVGLRFGATLAVAAAQEMADRDQPIAALALLAPPASGEAFCKELRLLAMMARTKPAAGGAVGGIEAAGFYFSPRTLAAMKALASARIPAPPAPRILIMDREDGGGATLGEAWRSEGCAVETMSFPGYTALMRDAAVTKYPEADFDQAVAWLAKDAPSATVPVSTLPRQSTLAIPGGREEAVSIGAAGMFGILGTPDAPQPGRPALLIVNTAANRHIGHNRLSVLIARRLVLAGVSVLRFDACGLGDSPSAPDRPDQAVFKMSLVPDVREAVDFLAARGHGEIVVNGLSAGGWLTYQATVADPRITGQIVLNLANLWVEHGLAARLGAANREYLRRIREKETWIRLVKGKLQLGLIVRMMSSRVLEAITIRIGQGVGRLRGTETMVRKTMRELGAAARRGARSAFIYVREDPGFDEMEVNFGRGGRKLAAIPGVSIILIEDGDHVFSLKPSRDHLVELMAAQFSQGRFTPTEAPHLTSSVKSTATLQSQIA